jgi:spermidine/putrescine transport system permease protein
VRIRFLLLLFVLTAVAGPGCKEQRGGADAPDEHRLNIYCWSEYIPQSVIDAFTAETGIKVSVQNYASMEEMVQKLLSGGGSFDLIQPAENTVEALIANGELLPIDFANVPNIKNLSPEFRNLPHDPDNKYTVPWMSGIAGIVVNTEKVKEPVTGFKDVFTDAHKDRIVVPEDARELVTIALRSLDLPPNNITPDALDRIKPVLAKWLKLVKTFDSDSPKTSFLNGEVDLGIVWSGEAALLYAQDKKFKWVVPAEGAHRFVDSLAIPKSCRHKANAEAFMDFVLRPRISRMISEKFPYTNPNAEARKLLTPEQLATPASYPSAEDKARLFPFKDIGKMSGEVETLITDLRAR